MERSNEGHNDTSGTPPVYHFPFYYPGMVEHNMAVSSVQNFQANINNAQAHTPPMMLPQYNVYPQCHALPMISSYQFNRSERRAAALAKFRQKRKERCFDKKVRYVNRKKLAETRPRVRGQFVRQASNMDIISTGDDISEDEDDDPSSREVDMVSSPE
jgi:pseudo-response regulator 1